MQNRLHARCGCGHAHEGGGNARPFILAGSPRHFERDRPFAIDSLSADIELDVEKKSVRGAAKLGITRRDPAASAIVLDAIAFSITKVEIDGKKARFTYDGKKLSIDVSPEKKSAEIEIVYGATPRRGLYFLEPDPLVPDRPRQVWSQCQEEDARHFIPCHDAPHVKMKTEMRVTAPAGWYVLSNGALVSSGKDAQGRAKFHWKMDAPHSSYLMTIVAGEFAEITDRAGEIPVSYLVPKGKEADGRRTFARTPDMITHFGKLTGVPYPWNKYAQVVVSDFIFGGMENTTATTMYEHILLDTRAVLDITSDDLIAHELAHQWFGDYVTCRDWSEGWLNEGFATYMEHAWREEHLGRDEYEFGVRGDFVLYASETHARYKRAIVCQDYDAPLDLFDRHLYEKGALTLHVLRTELGADLFWRGIGLYLQRNAQGVVETRDLMRSLEEVSGKSLGKMFDELVYKPGHPEIEVSISWDSGVIAIAAKQTHAHTDGVPVSFEVPLELAIVTEKGSRTERVTMTTRAETFAIPCDERPRFVVVDPRMRVLGEIVVRAPDDMLRTQLTNAETARGRWLAAQALSRSDDPETIAALGKRLADEKEFWGVRAESADALGKIRARECETVLLANVETRHPKVRRAVCEALGAFKTQAAAQALVKRAQGDESYLVSADSARALGKTKDGRAFDALLDVIDRRSWSEVVSIGAIDGLAALRDERATAHLQTRVRYGHPTRARRAAILALPKLSGDRKTREILEELLEDNDPYLRIDAVRALVDLGDVRARAALKSRLDVDTDARVRRRIREALRDLGGDGRRAGTEMREHVEKLEGEISEMRARLAKLEARSKGEPSAPVTKAAPKKKEKEKKRR